MKKLLSPSVECTWVNYVSMTEIHIAEALGHYPDSFKVCTATGKAQFSRY
jgi:hypothetical protein